MMLAALALVAMAGAGNMTETRHLTIPYNPKDTGHCYERLSQTQSVYQDAVRKIREALESDRDFSARMKSAMALNKKTIEQSQTLPHLQPWIEEDVYLCCLYDMLESVVSAETTEIVSGKDNPKQKEARLKAVLDDIASLPFGSPQYRTGIRPRLEKPVKNAMKKLKDSK